MIDAHQLTLKTAKEQSRAWSTNNNWLQGVREHNNAIAKTKDPTASDNAFKERSPNFVLSAATSCCFESDALANSRVTGLGGFVVMFKNMNLPVHQANLKSCHRDVIKVLLKPKERDCASGASNSFVIITFHDTLHLINSSLMANANSKHQLQTVATFFVPTLTDLFSLFCCFGVAASQTSQPRNCKHCKCWQWRRTPLGDPWNACGLLQLRSSLLFFEMTLATPTSKVVSGREMGLATTGAQPIA